MEFFCEKTVNRVCYSMIIGIDTSCYTTSIALITSEGEILLDSRRLLEVASGERGLRQSEALFQHLQNLPLLLAADHWAPGQPPNVDAVCAAVIPRPAPDSYLPVFKAGAAFGQTLAGLYGIPFIGTSHQEGHIRAGLKGNRELKGEFLAWHISGGTTELLLVRPDHPGFAIQKIGGSSDLHVGQFIDRVGVALGTGFPAGPELERLAEGAEPGIHLPIAVQGLSLSFSGPASAAERALHSGTGAGLAYAVFECIGRSLLLVTRHAAEIHGIDQVLVVGGVAANKMIRSYLTDAGAHEGLHFFFGSRELSSDNAVGVALIGRDFLSGN